MTEKEAKQVAITGDPVNLELCRFTIDRPIYPGQSFYFGKKEQAKGSSLAERLFDIEGITAVLISHDQVTVTKNVVDEWPVLGRRVGAAIRAHLATNQPAVSTAARTRIPAAAEIRARVEEVLDTQINPAVAAHGGHVGLIDVKENVVYLQMGGGCQGCGMADVTLKQGVETAIRDAVPEVGDILDITDHASGRNPYYRPSKK